MPRTIDLVHRYPHSPDLVWLVAIDLDHLARIASGKVTFRRLPKGRIFKGQVIDVEVSLFGAMPFQPYRMEVTDFDPVAKRFRSSEKGAGVKSWRHSLQVFEDGGGARVEESIEIDAGLLTPLFCRWAQFLYASRHKPRLDILKELDA